MKSTIATRAPTILSIATKATMIAVTSATVRQWSLEASSSAGSRKSRTSE
jgi:hypothetical protein